MRGTPAFRRSAATAISLSVAVVIILASAGPAAAHPWAARASYAYPAPGSSPTLYPHSWGLNANDRVILEAVSPNSPGRVSSWMRSSGTPTPYQFILNGAGVRTATVITSARWVSPAVDRLSFNLYQPNTFEVRNAGGGPRMFVRSLRIGDPPDWSSYSAALDVTSTEFPAGSGLNGVTLRPYTWDIPVNNGKVSMTFKAHGYTGWGATKVHMRVSHRTAGDALGVVDVNGNTLMSVFSPDWTTTDVVVPVNRGALNTIDFYNDGPPTAGSYQVRAVRIY